MEFIKEKNRIYSEDETGKIIALVEFPEEEEGIVNLTHTEVDPSLQGQGIAGKLMQLFTEEMRADGRKAVLSCSYAVKWFDRHPDARDVLAEDPDAQTAGVVSGEFCGIG